MKNKDEEIEKLKSEISNLKTTMQANKQSHSDLTLRQFQMEDELKNLHGKCKLLEEKNSDLLRKVVYLKESTQTSITTAIIPEDPNLNSSDTTTSQNDYSIPPSCINIPTSNQYEFLPEEPSNSNTEAEKPKELDSCSQNEQPNETDHQSQGKYVNESETIIICDSNGRYLQPKLLCPDTKNSYIRCPTLSKAKTIIQNTTFTSPRTFIIHCGTNDLESTKSNEQVVNQTMEVITEVKKKFPETRILISSLLPRNDILDERSNIINKELEKIISSKPKVTFVKHDHITKSNHLKDKKHLNIRGVKLFARDLKAAYFNTPIRRICLKE